MARRNRLKPAAADDSKSGRKCSQADRASYFARREAAKILRCVLQGDAQRKAVASIKSLVYSPSVRNKKATFALVCQTLRYLPIIKDVLSTSDVLNSKWKEELMYMIAYDILFGQDVKLQGDAEKFLLLRKNALQTALARLLVREKVKSVDGLLLKYSQAPDVSSPRYVRVNSLKLDIESAIQELGKVDMVTKDDMVSDLLVLPSGTDLHDHPLVVNGSVFLQGKASCMVAAALSPEPGWVVLDACSAPGNKTVHLAALMRGKGKVIACELNEERVKRLEDTVRRSGASNIKVIHGDFLGINTEDPMYSKVRAILLDPSCSGSGTANKRLDYLLPSHTTGRAADGNDNERLEKLAAFQRKALEHALSFPSVERVVYSTCSIHQIENEDVVESVLPLATSLNFQLEAPFPQWERRGHPVFEGAENLLRTDLAEDMEGFFIALFVRKTTADYIDKPICDYGETSRDYGCTNSSLREVKINNKERNIKPSLSSSRNKLLGKRPVLFPFLQMHRMLQFCSLPRGRTHKKHFGT
ncbi:25S rRNA (cytosine-C(5))-methyltransferase NSUN5 isoform X2 [Aristolochia californica]|uniref:25S rRNA (cytosine-C(5))-methyltransferase NSUN5 isoform X2 n=1 Tax=Aristolochia californica TaxID=171875 RepID=UPI0035DE1C98